MNKCKNCGNEFVPFQKKRYCQNKCIKQYHKKQAIIRKRQERLNDDKHKQRVLFETSLDGEIWKDITNYDGYMVSNMGRIMSKKTKQLIIRKLTTAWDGYMEVGLYRSGKMIRLKVHRLVAQAFIPNPENKPEVNHIDFDRRNNILANLEWCTSQENRRHTSYNKMMSRTKNTNPIK